MKEDKTAIKVQVQTADIAFLVQVMEGHDYIGVVTTSDPKNGLVVLQVTPDTYEDAKLILENLPIEKTILG